LAIAGDVCRFAGVLNFGEVPPGIGLAAVTDGRSSPWRATRLQRMSAISRDEVAHLAMLARIDLSDAELDKMSGELAVILESVARVSEVAADDVPPMSHPLPLTNVTRPDDVRPSLTAEEALAGAPASEQQRFSVPRILDED
jgi:aspartyl-tRNA(Asn)/glutamyl-tRNA(Gln) amidotransferase subunit C